LSQPGERGKKPDFILPVCNHHLDGDVGRSGSRTLQEFEPQSLAPCLRPFLAFVVGVQDDEDSVRLFAGRHLDVVLDTELVLCIVRALKRSGTGRSDSQVGCFKVAKASAPEPVP
jgi:hypothetical protein